MKKSVSKRIKITRRGKVIQRGKGLNHFRTRKSKQQIRDTRKTLSLNSAKKQIVNYGA